MVHYVEEGAIQDTDDVEHETQGVEVTNVVGVINSPDLDPCKGGALRSTVTK